MKSIFFIATLIIAPFFLKGQELEIKIETKYSTVYPDVSEEKIIKKLASITKSRVANRWGKEGEWGIRSR